MDWKKIETSLDNTHYLYEGRRLFGKNFIEVLNFHTPGIAAVLDASGGYHIDASGTPLYAHRYRRVFGYYCSRAAVVDNDGAWYHIDEHGTRSYEQGYA